MASDSRPLGRIAADIRTRRLVGEEGKVSEATRSVDRPLCHGFRAVVWAIRVAVIVGLSGLASIALGVPGALGDDGPVQTPNPYEGVYAAARPCNGKELGRSLRYTHAEAVGRVRP